MPPAGFEPIIPASERLQTHALDRVATGIGNPWTVQPVASRYTDYAIPTHYHVVGLRINKKALFQHLFLGDYLMISKQQGYLELNGMWE
jgi:hypothetical protein